MLCFLTSMPSNADSPRRLSEAAKREVLRRFGGRCAFCLIEARGSITPFSVPQTMRPEMAHFKAWSHGGESSIGNIIPLCLDHHEKFDKQNQGSRLSISLEALLREPGTVTEQLVCKIHEDLNV